MLVIQSTVRASNICAHKDHGNGLPSGHLQFWQSLDCLLSNLFRVFEEFGRNVITSDDSFCAIFSGHGSHVSNGIEELPIVPKTPSFPISGETLDGFLHDELRAFRIIFEIV